MAADAALHNYQGAVPLRLDECLMLCMRIMGSDLCCVMGGWGPRAAIQVSHANLQRLKGFTAVCALVPCDAFPVGISQRRPGTVPGVRKTVLPSR